jgi:16S rRNA (adenine1518-N6/adenine1519-N6)-dimethyltransferase
VTHSGADIAQLLSTHGLRPSRALGQNFVADPNTVRRIARLAGVGAGDQVLEIGAGLGSLTLALAETGARVLAVETDHHIVPVLRSAVEPAGVEVVEGDALTLDLAGLLAAHGDGAWSLVANLPYNVATPLVMRTLTGVSAVTLLLVMVQREVGERMAAAVGDDGYGAVSVRVAYFARAEVVGRVPASVFIPRPRVESVLVRIVRRAQPAVDPGVVSYERLDAVVRAGFGQRRKMLRRALAGVVDPEAFVRAGVRPEARAEELDVAAWGRLAAL